MERRVLLFTCLLFIAVLGWIGYEYLLPYPLLPKPIRSVTPSEAGLDWQECQLPVLESPSNAPAWDEPEACFGHPAPIPSDAERSNFGQYVANEAVQLTVGQDVYKAHANDISVLTRYDLYRNESRIKSLIGVGDTLWLRMFLQNIGGKVAWGIANENPATIIYDGKDVRHLYGLDKAHASYSLADKLIFVAQKGGKYFVMYDGQKVGPDFNQIIIGYCCDTAFYSVRFGQGKYQFRGTRGGKNYIVEISAPNISR
jgi:hypothetical protein